MPLGLRRVGAVFLVLMGCSISVWAAPSIPHPTPQFKAYIGECVRRAAHHYEVNAELLTALVIVESQSWPYALGDIDGGNTPSVYARSFEEAKQLVQQWWKEGKTFSVGLGQIHSKNIKRFALEPEWLLDPCVNALWAAYILRNNFERFGVNWTAVERYNGNNPQYPWRVYRALQQLVVLEEAR